MEGGVAMDQWTQEEIEAMRLADAEIEAEFRMTLDEIEESRERDTEALDGQLDFRDLHRQLYNRSYNKRYYEKNREKLNCRCRAYHAANRERENRRSEAWREANRDYSKTYQRAYYQEHQEDILLKKRLAAEVDRAYRAIMSETEAEQA